MSVTFESNFNEIKMNDIIALILPNSGDKFGLIDVKNGDRSFNFYQAIIEIESSCLI
jgi:hypothetical protein